MFKSSYTAYLKPYSFNNISHVLAWKINYALIDYLSVGNCLEIIPGLFLPLVVQNTELLVLIRLNIFGRQDLLVCRLPLCT